MPENLTNTTVNQATRAQGLADLSDVADRRVYTPDDVIAITGDTDDSPYYRLLSMLKKEPCNSFKFSWYRDEDYSNKAEISTAATAGAATVIIPDYETITAGTIMHVIRTGEALRATATPTDSSVAVTRGLGDTTGTAILSGDVVILGQVAVTEGSGPVDTYSSEPWKEYNYVETRRHGWKVTRHAQIEHKWGSNDKIGDEEIKHLKKLKREIETSNLFGVRASTTVSGSQLYLSGGINNIAKADNSRSRYINWAGVGLTQASFDYQVRQYYNTKNSGGNVIALCGDNILTILNSWTQDKLQIVDQATDMFGTHVYRYQCTNGEVVNFLPHRLWTREWKMDDRIWFLDMDHMAMRGLPGGPMDITRMTRAKDITSTEIAPNGYDYYWNELWQESGLAIKGTENVAIFEGIYA